MISLFNLVIKPIFAQSPTGNFNIGQAGQGFVPHAATGNYEANFWSWVSSLLSIIMPIAALLVLAYLIWGAIEWITSEGDSGKLQKARNKMMHAVLGMIVLAATLAIFMVLQQFLGICVISIGGSCTGTSGGGGNHHPTPTSQQTSCHASWWNAERQANVTCASFNSSASLCWSNGQQFATTKCAWVNNNCACVNK